MTMKFNCLECCYESTFTEKLLTECKKATSKAVTIDDIKWGCGLGVACVPKAMQLEKVGTYARIQVCV